MAQNYESTRFIRPEEGTASLDSAASSTREQISKVSKRDSQGWRVFFAGDKETIDELAKNVYITSKDVVYKEESNGSFIKNVRKKINDQNAEFDGVVFCTPPEDVLAFRGKNQYAFENRFDPPVIYFSDHPIQSEKRLLNVWYVNTKEKHMVLLKQDLVEAIKAGKNFVEFVKKASLIIMAKNPAEYADLKRRKPDTFYVVPATEKGYYQAKAYLTSSDLVVDDPKSKLKGKTFHGKGIFVGGVAIDGLDSYQTRLSLKMDNELLLGGIPFAYIGVDNASVRFHLKEFKRCKIIPGEDIQQKGLMRLLEDYDPSMRKTEAEVKIHYSHDVILRGSGKKVKRSLTARFEDPGEIIDPAAETQKMDYEKKDPELLERLKSIVSEVEEEQRKIEAERNAMYNTLERFR